MDQAKVVINIKEGVIELEGPVDFVRHYLDTYQSAIKELQVPRDVAVVAGQGKPKASPRKRKEVPVAKAGKGERGSCTRAIRSHLEAGFFDEPRSTSAVKQKLSETGLACTDSNVRASLGRLVRSGSLGATGRSRSLRYHRPERS